MIEEFALHEFRHLYQFDEIEKYNVGNYDGDESVDKIKRWAYEFEHYINPKNNIKGYYDQDIEFDAFTFAYAALKYKYKCLPNYIQMPKYYIGKYEILVEEWNKKFSKIFE